VLQFFYSAYFFVYKLLIGLLQIRP